MSLPRLLFVHAHPDDESLWTGGTLARHIARGGEADLVTCTWAEGTERHAELLDAAARLGLPRAPIMLGYADDRVPESAPGMPRFCAAPFDEPVRSLVTLIRRLRPEAIITYDAAGIYGHPDHVHTHRLAISAATSAAEGLLYASSGDPWQVQSLYLTTLPNGMVDDVHADMLADMPRTALPGTPEEQIDVVLDVTAWREAKTSAIEAHRSELRRSRTMRALMSLASEERARLLGTEYYQRRDLVPGGADLG